MPVDPDMITVPQTVGSLLGRVRPTGLLATWLRERGRRATIKAHQRTILGIYTAGDLATVEVDHEERPEWLRLRLRVDYAFPGATAGPGD